MTKIRNWIILVFVVAMTMVFSQSESDTTKTYKNTATKEKTLKDEYKQLRQQSWEKKQEFKKAVNDTIK